MNFLESYSVSFDNLTASCRLCLSVNCKLYQIFQSDETEALAVPLSIKVTLCTAVAVSKNDNLPQKICQNCLNYVNNWYMFRKKCKRVNSYLKQNVSLQNNKNEKINSKEGYQGNENIIAAGRIPVAVQTSTNNEEIKLDKLDMSNENILVDNDDEKDEVASLKSLRKKKFKCSTCPDSFYYLKDLKLHKNVIHNSARMEIPEKVSTVADTDIHLQGINIRTRYEMKCCNKMFFSKLKFRKHYNEKHPGEKPFMCETCGKKDFISEETLKRHKVLHTGKFRCDICLKTFTCNAILILHKRDKHENDKPFICDVCGKRFVTELLMNYHKRFHTGEKKYVCEECGLAVVTSSSLAKHKRIHSKEKPHVCHVCGKGFIIKGRLVEHLRVHTGERPYSCQLCQKGFTMRDKLKRHMRVHSGEKLFSCEYCGNNYSTRYGLSVHLKSHMTKCF